MATAPAYCHVERIVPRMSANARRDAMSASGLNIDVVSAPNRSRRLRAPGDV